MTAEGTHATTAHHCMEFTILKFIPHKSQRLTGDFQFKFMQNARRKGKIPEKNFKSKIDLFTELEETNIICIANENLVF